MGKNFLGYSIMYNNPIDYKFFDGNLETMNINVKEELKKFYLKKLESNNFLDKNKETDNLIIFEQIKKKKENSEREEAVLAKRLLGISNYIGLEDKEKTQRWTKYFFNLENATKEQVDPITWLRVIFSSSEFAQKLSTHKGSTAFYRSGLINEKLLSKEEVEEDLMNKFKDVKTVEDFESALEKYGFYNDLRNAIYNQIGNKKIKIKSPQIENVKIKDFISLKEAIKNWGELVVKDVINRYKKSKNYDKDIENKLKKLNVTTSDKENKIYFSINLEEQKGQLSISKTGSKSIAEAFYNAATAIIHSFFPKKDSTYVFHIGGNRTIQLKYIGWAELISAINEDKRQRADKVKIKSEYDSNVYGFLGEYLQLYSSDSIQLTGEQVDTYNGISLGESFSDAFFEENGKKYGLNIKHYISKFNSDSITLYESENSLSFFSQYMLRYFTEEECNLIRFLDINYNFFSNILGGNIDSKHLLMKYNQLAYNNLSRFVRIDSAAIDEYSNIFYIINNMYIPTSCIYNVILKELKNINAEKFNIDSNRFFSFSFNPANAKVGKEKIDPNNLEKTIPSLLISNYVGTAIKSTRISFKGLKITGLKNLLYNEVK